MKTDLIEIRKELMIGVEAKDLLYIKMQINKLDTLIHSDIKETECKCISMQPYLLPVDECLECGMIQKR